MMTLDEAIKHAEEKACGNTACTEEHRQLAEWLKELRNLRCAYKRLSKQVVSAHLETESYLRFIKNEHKDARYV